MRTPYCVVLTFSMGLVMIGAGLAYSQTYPTRPIRIMTAGVGGGTDVAARLIAQGLTDSLGQQVIVDNRPSGVIPGDIVAKASPDGYTLLLANNSLWIGQLLQAKTPYDVVKDFAPISWTNRSPLVLAINASVPAKSVKDLIALAKAKPGQLNYASGATGSSGHLAAELFKSMAGVNIIRIPYKTPAGQMADLIAGQVQLNFAIPGTVAPHVKAGRLAALAVTSSQPSALLSDLPTVAAAGLPGYEAESIYGILAPAGTPPRIINRLNQEIVKVLNRADVKEKLFNGGSEIVGSSPAQLGAIMKADMFRMSKVIKEAGIQDD